MTDAQLNDLETLAQELTAMIDTAAKLETATDTQLTDLENVVQNLIEAVHISTEYKVEAHTEKFEHPDIYKMTRNQLLSELKTHNARRVSKLKKIDLQTILERVHE
jgi:hypothetical protein